jgi:SAM-dependent methyltransferase
VSFDVAADAYVHFMGRFSGPLAEQFVRLAGPRPGERALDVGCGPAVATALLVDLLGADHVAAVDPSKQLVGATRDRFPDADVRLGYAEDLPFRDATFDVALAQLVVPFMADPVAGLREMGRVVRPGGTVAACAWDVPSGHSPLGLFWRAADDLSPGASGAAVRPGMRPGHLADLARDAGLEHLAATELEITVRCASFEEWWTPFLLGVGPAGEYVESLDDAGRAALRERSQDLVSRELGADGSFEIRGRAWAVTAQPAASDIGP